MAKPKKKETVSVSFHYLVRMVGNGGKDALPVAFTSSDFDALFGAIQAKAPFDPNDEEAADRIRYRSDAPMENVIRVDDRTVFGTYKGSYWGHAYDNTMRGRIPAESISLRPFHFLLYLSKSGRIYLASQYLGQFGGYSALQRTISDLMPGAGFIMPHSVRLDGASYKNAQAKEVKVTFAEKPASLAASNKITSAGMIAFRKMSKEDGFEAEVAKRLFPFLGGPKNEMRKAIASMLNESSLMEVSESDIMDCTVLAKVNGGTKTIYMLESGNFATKFHIDVKVDDDGHPDYNQTKIAILDVLREEIISRSSDV
ncbi:hypothetical protein [Brevundimonas sp.]|uniref:hypothetical protein n=1 Tax=Brevundimonas sp. TaxID=1871086 RepID=UPI0028B21B5E|nr:hypothetical protein [Brevundimonas sp.]